MQRKKRLLIAFVILTTAGVIGIAFGAPPLVFDVDREFHPYYPSLVKWNKSNAEFTPPTVTRSSTKSGPVRSIASRSRI